MANAWIMAPLPIAAASASSSAAGRDPAYVGNDYAGVVWRSASATAATLTLDLGADQTVDTLALFGVDGAGAATLLSIDGATAAQPGTFTALTPAAPLLAGAVMPRSGRGVALADFAPAVCRYLRLNFGAPVSPIEVARAVVGKRIALERNFGLGGSFGVRDLGSVEFSRRGVLMRRRGKKMRTASISFSNIHRDEVEAMIQPLIERLGNTETVLLVTNPEPHQERQNRCYFGFLVGDLASVQRRVDGFEAQANVASLF